MNKQADKRTNEQPNEWTNIRSNKQTNKLTQIKLFYLLKPVGPKNLGPEN